jgi:hypothetical protein
MEQQEASVMNIENLDYLSDDELNLFVDNIFKTISERKSAHVIQFLRKNLKEHKKWLRLMTRVSISDNIDFALFFRFLEKNGTIWRYEMSFIGPNELLFWNETNKGKVGDNKKLKS